MDCPVCQRQNVPPEFSTCPQCDTDLRGLRLLESLRVAAAQHDSPAHSTLTLPAGTRPAWVPPALVGVLTLAVALLAGRIGILPTGSNPSKLIDSGPLSAAQSALPVYKDSVALLRKQLAATKSLNFVYVVRRGDTLRGIAWRLYGHAELAEQLGQMNHIADPRRLPIGQPLRLMSI